MRFSTPHPVMARSKNGAKTLEMSWLGTGREASLVIWTQARPFQSTRSLPRFSLRPCVSCLASSFDERKDAECGRLDGRRIAVGLRRIRRGESPCEPRDFRVTCVTYAQIPGREGANCVSVSVPIGTGVPKFSGYVRELDWRLAARIFWPAAWVRTPARKIAWVRSIRCLCCNLWEKFGFAGTVHYEGAPGGHELTSLREVIGTLIGA